MSRRKEIPKREILPDPKYRSIRLAKFANIVMRDGKKSVAQRILYNALDIVSNTRTDVIAAMEEALENVTPMVEVKGRRVGGATYQVPVEVRPSRRMTLAMRWMMDAASKRGEKTAEKRLAGEMMDALEKRGAAVKKREDTHRMAEANRAFGHYRW